MQNNIPAWLESPPKGEFPLPPVNTRAQTLPFSALTWENFERLIVRIVRREQSIEDCKIYGTKGQAQHGLDILATKKDSPGKFSCYQCKRVKEFSANQIKKAVDEFLKGKWADKTENFILCTTLALNDTSQIDEINSQKERLAEKNIIFEIWDSSNGGALPERLKVYPDLVDDFFLRAWVSLFNGRPASEALDDRLNGAELASLRINLKDVYETLFQRYDQGLRLGSQSPAPLLGRYTVPVVIEKREIVTTEPQSVENSPHTEEQYYFDEKKSQSPAPLIHSSSTQEVRIPIEEWLSRHGKTVILGEPGYGKSALLRVITLQILNDRDDLFQLPWCDSLPVWISFGGFSAAIQDQPNLNLEDYFDLWLHKNSADNVRQLFKRAAKLGKILLLVDGLDEGQDINASKQAMDRISTFLSTRKIPAVFTSRPLGYDKLGSNEVWPIARLGAFDEEQIESFTQMWFKYLEIPEHPKGDINNSQFLNAKQHTNDFLRVLRTNHRVMDLAQTPLFCQLLIDIFRFSHHLPEQQIRVYEKIVELLLSDHPAARMQAAGLTDNNAPRPEDMRDMLMKLALHIKERGGAGVISIKDCKNVFCGFLTDDINGPGFTRYEAKHQAQSIIDHAQAGLGLIVERSPGELGFFHLTIQDYLAAQSIVRKTEDEQLAWLESIWNKTKWHEVALAWFSIRGNDQGKQATQPAIERLKESANTPWAQLQLLLLRTELAANDYGLSPREARATIEEAADQIETSPYPEITKALASQITLGLRTPSISKICEARIANWLPGRSEWGRASLFQALGSWQPSDDLLDTLKLGLHDESLRCSRAAAESLAKVYSDKPTIGDELSVMATNWPDLTVRASTMYCLWKGWPNHESLPGLADNARRSMDMDLALIGIAIRVSLGVFDEDDRENIWSMLINDKVSYELRDMCCKVLVQGWSNDDKLKLLALESLQDSLYAGMKNNEQVATFLAHAWPGDAEVAASISNFLSHSSPFFIHNDYFWEGLITGFCGNEAISKVLRSALSERYSEHEPIYWGPDTKQLYCTICDEASKRELLDAYSKKTGSQEKYWICSTLMEAWGNDTEVNELLAKEFLKPPEEVAFLGEWVKSFILDRESRRNWLLSAIKNPEHGLAISVPVRNLLHEFHDNECLVAVKAAIKEDIWYYHKVAFQSELIEIFPNDHQVKEWIATTLNDIDGPSIASIAVSHEKDKIIRLRLLAAACPAKNIVRSEIFKVLREHAIPTHITIRLTENIWAEDNRLIRTSGILTRCIATQLPSKLIQPLVKKLQDEINSTGSYMDARRSSAFVGLLELGEYKICIDALTKNNTASLHWLTDYHKSDTLMAHILFENWNELERTAKKMGTSLKIPWQGFIYNGSARKALVKKTIRTHLAESLMNSQSQNRSPESLTLMAEMLPGSPELRNFLLDTIKDRSSNDSAWQAQRLYAEQFGGDEQALIDLKNIWPVTYEENDEIQHLPPYLYALILGWPKNQYLSSLLQQDTLPKMPIHVYLVMSAINDYKSDVSGCINKMIELTMESKYNLSGVHIDALKKWASSPNSKALLQKLIVDSDCSRKITAISLSAATGRLSKKDRLELINDFNELISDNTKHSPDGLDLTDGNVSTLPQVLVSKLLIGQD